MIMHVSGPYQRIWLVAIFGAALVVSTAGVAQQQKTGQEQRQAAPHRVRVYIFVPSAERQELIRQQTKASLRQVFIPDPLAVACFLVLIFGGRALLRARSQRRGMAIPAT